ncbi:hypothetical protein [Streptosporangium roseum]|uniref:hypothetical protein n=1 Tax=Streptosporangium roseum TaxID=2001 RepID=UPI0004CCD322|nr:hypothetical protein [Streptosporangium roseum]
MLLARHLLSVAVAVAAVSAVTALPAAAVQQPAAHTAPAGPPMCVDANGTRVHLWECSNTDTNQKSVIDDGMIKVKDTLA